MPPAGCVVDSMLLVLYVAGRTNARIIAKHRNLGAYTADDFNQLSDLIADLGGVIWLTPNTLTETSNLLGQHGSPEREQLLETLRGLIAVGREVMVQSNDAAEHPLFPELGLTDAALLGIVSSDRPLLTMDGGLYAAALADNQLCALNFNHFRGDELATK